MSFPDDPAEPAVAAPPLSEPILETAESAEVAADAEGDAAPPPRRSGYASDRSFADFPISSEVLLGVQALGYEMATPVQALTIDAAIAGKDLLVRAKTGTGKTAAFCVPMVERCPAGARRVSGIVLTPTRELAVQVAQECAGIAKYKDLTIVAIYGGVGFGPQEEALKAGAEIVVGTPGRVLDHLRRGNLDLSDLKVAVLDEADEMLSMGFLEDVKKILSKAPKERQNLLFSATVDETIKGLIASYLNNPEEIFLSFDGDNVSTITHILYETSPDYHKARALLDLIEQERPNAAIVFCNTREDVSTVYTYLDRQGLGVEMLSGELPQKQRERVMARIKSGAVQFLVSTDVAARGIDITDLTHVINYSLPDDAAIYLHRCGRTGRIGKSGVAITLAGGADFSTRITLTRTHKIDFQIKTLPTAEESGRLRTERFVRIIKDAAGSTAYEGYLDLVRAIKERPDGDMLLAVAIRGLLSWDRARKNAAADDTGGAAEAEARSEDRPREAPRDRDGRGGRDGGRDGGRRDERGRDARSNDRPRDDRPRDARPGDRGPDRGPRRDDRARDDRPRQSDRPRDDRPRDDRPRDDRPRGDRPRHGDRPRDDRPRERGNDAPRDRGDQRPPVSTERAENDVVPRAVAPESAESEEDTSDGPTNPGAAGEGADGAARKKRRRRRRRSGGEGTGPTGGGAGDAGAAPPTAAE